MKKDKHKEKEKEDANAESHKIPQINDISARVPTMIDSELATLLANAQRLKLSGSAIQRKTAEFLLPLIEEETAKRKAAKGSSKKGAAAAKRKKAAAEAKEAESEPEEQEEEMEA